MHKYAHVPSMISMQTKHGKPRLYATREIEKLTQSRKIFLLLIYRKIISQLKLLGACELT